jgi:manganese/zinc/iron transport system substrate-binding protein
MHLRHILTAVFGTVFSVFLCGCGQPQAGDATTDPAAHTPLRIVTTTAMVNDLVARIGGDLVDAKALIGEGVDPHLYKPTSADVVELSNANAVFYSGLMLEGKMADVLVKVATKGKPVFAVTERIDEAFLLHEEGEEGYADPHVWMDVQGWRLAADVVRDGLLELLPEHADAIKANADALSSELNDLHAYVKKVIATIPAQKRVLITAHDAFGYFGRAYDLEVRGIQGLSTETEAGLHDLNKLVEFIVDRKITAVFVESSVPEKNVKALLEGAQAKGHEVVIGGELFSDAMGGPGTYEGTYVGMIDHNATIIARALGGEAPEKGVNGKLSHK